MLRRLRTDFVKAKSLPNIRSPGPTSGGCIETRWYANTRILKEKRARAAPTLKELAAIGKAEPLADE
jgi:hypothetical protein